MNGEPMLTTQRDLFVFVFAPTAWAHLGPGFARGAAGVVDHRECQSNVKGVVGKGSAAEAFHAVSCELL